MTEKNKGSEPSEQGLEFLNRSDTRTEESAIPGLSEVADFGVADFPVALRRRGVEARRAVR